MLDFYEIKYEISRDEEPAIAADLGLMFTEEYADLDIYLKTRRRDAFKLKVTGEGNIFYQIKLVNGVFVIMGKALENEQLQELLKTHPIEIEMNRINRVYAWKKFMVKCDFDYIKQFPDKAFLKIYSISREPVEEAKADLIASGFRDTVDLPYNKLYWKEHPEFRQVISRK